jgi:hypothetical protein
MSQPWPPPPDLASLQELVRNADPEGLLADGAPADEYDPEENALFAALKGLPTADLLATTVLPLIEVIWQKNFSHSEDDLSAVRPKLLALAKEIERFFGPQSQPRTRADILRDNATGTPAG